MAARIFLWLFLLIPLFLCVSGGVLYRKRPADTFEHDFATRFKLPQLLGYGERFLSTPSR